MVERGGLRLHSTRGRYGFAVLLAAVAGLVDLGWSLLFQETIITPFLGVILLTGWYAGTGPVVLTTVLSTLIVLLFLAPIDLSWPVAARLTWFGLFAFGAASFGAARRNAERRLESARNELEERVAARREELRRSQVYLNAAQQLSHTGSAAWRIATGEVAMSQEGLRIHGLESKTGVVELDVLRQLWHPDDLSSVQQSLDAAVREKRSFEIESRIVRPDGAIRYLRGRGRPVFDESGELVEYISAMMDVTSRRRASLKLRRAREAALEARLAAMFDERTRLARELHDTLLQGFTGIGLSLIAVANRIEGPPEAVAALRDLIASTQRTLQDARRAIWDIRPHALGATDFSTRLGAAARDAVRGSGIELEEVVEGTIQGADPDIETAALRVLQEAVTNVVKHAAARTVRLAITYERKRIRLSVTDDGRGFVVEPDLRAYGGHLGLLGMRERAREASGSLSIKSSPGEGTEIVLLVPYARRVRPRQSGMSPAKKAIALPIVSSPQA